MDNINFDLFRSRVDTIILSVLQEKDRYVYEILDLIYKNSVSHYEIKQSTLYNSMKRLEATGLVISYEGAESNGAKRKYYSLTEDGKQLLNKEKTYWEYTRTLLDKLVSDKEIDLATVSPPFNASSLKPLTPRAKSNQLTNINPVIESYEKGSSDKELEFCPSTESMAPRTNLGKSSFEFDKARDKASEILGLGIFEPINVDDRVSSFIDNSSSPTLSSLGAQTYPVNNETTPYQNYREALGSLYDDPDSKVSPLEDVEEFVDMENRSDGQDYSSSSHHFNDMKQLLSNEGFRIKIYSRANSSNFYYMNYYYSNKLLRDSTLLTYLLFFIGLLVFSIFKNETIPWIILSVSIFIPVIGIYIWKQNPLKRIRATNKYIISVIIGLCIYLLLIGIVLSFSFLLNINNITYPVYIFLFAIPLFTIIKTFLYRTKRYHLKK